MAKFPYKTALIVGIGPGIRTSLARGLSALGVGVGLAARDVEKLKRLANETGAKTFAVDASDPSTAARLFLGTERLLAEPDVVIYNAGSRVAGRLADLDPAARHPEHPDHPDGTLDPDAIAQRYIDVLSQPRSSWSFDVDLRPWTEPF